MGLHTSRRIRQILRKWGITSMTVQVCMCICILVCRAEG